MYDPSMRVLTVLELLQSQGRISGDELAAHMEVSLRTVQRYIARLQDLGFPVTSVRGPGGYYRLRPGFRLPPLMFSTDEALAVALGLDALTFLGLKEVAPQAAGVRAKLSRVLPEAVRDEVQALREVLELEHPQYVIAADVAILTQLASALYGSRCVRVRYRAQGGQESERVLEPLGLRQHEGRWFLAAYCRLRQGKRLFRLDRIARLEGLHESFEPPEAFSMTAFLQRSLSYTDAPEQVEVWLELPLAEVEARLPRATLSAEGSGTLLACGVNGYEWLALELLKLGCPIVVRRSEALKQTLAKIAERAQAASSRDAQT